MLAEALGEGLFRILVPFEDLTTTVYVVDRAGEVLLIDCATYPTDVDDYVLPALSALGIDPARVSTLALTHRHGDHAGGAARLCERLPQSTLCAFAPVKGLPTRLLQDGETITGGMQVLHLPGHTEDSVGYFDRTTGTLLSGDCLQLAGIGRYRNGVKLPDRYKASIERLRRLPIHRIVAAHEYDPLGSLARGEPAVQIYLDTCLDVIGG